MSISKLRHEDPAIVAFAFRGNLTRDDVGSMADTLNTAFDKLEKTRVLLDFRGLLDINADAMLSMKATKAQFRSLGSVVRYAVIDPPEAAGKTIEIFDRIIPIDAEVFDANCEEAAWRFIEGK